MNGANSLFSMPKRRRIIFAPPGPKKESGFLAGGRQEPRNHRYAAHRPDFRRRNDNVAGRGVHSCYRGVANLIQLKTMDEQRDLKHRAVKCVDAFNLIPGAPR